MSGGARPRCIGVSRESPLACGPSGPLDVGVPGDVGDRGQVAGVTSVSPGPTSR